MTDRKKIADDVKEAKTFPFFVKVDDVDRDYKKISAMLFRRGLSDKVGMARERGKGLLWFFRRKAK